MSHGCSDPGLLGGDSFMVAQELGGMTLKLELKLQYFGYLMRRKPDSLEKTQMLGKIEGRRKRG